MTFQLGKEFIQTDVHNGLKVLSGHLELQLLLTKTILKIFSNLNKAEMK